MVDASNIAHFGRAKDGKPRLDYILKAAKALKELGYEPVLIANESLRHEIDFKEDLINF